MQAETVTMPWGNKIPVPRGKQVLVCPNCKQELGFFDPDKLKIPLTPDMFDGLEPERGLYGPFPVMPGRSEAMDWTNATCLACGSNVFVNMTAERTEDLHVKEVMTAHGPLVIGEIPVPPVSKESKERQAEIDRVWQEESEKNLTPAERRQKQIEDEWGNEKLFIIDEGDVIPEVYDKLTRGNMEELEAVQEPEVSTKDEQPEKVNDPSKHEPPKEAEIAQRVANDGGQAVCPVCKDNGKKSVLIPKDKKGKNECPVCGVQFYCINCGRGPFKSPQALGGHKGNCKDE